MYTDIKQPTEGDDLVDTFICNCTGTELHPSRNDQKLTLHTDCRKITASMFASNFIVNDSALKHIRGQDKLTKFAQDKTIATGNTMANYFCSVCGTLMYRVSTGFPGKSILRIGTVDDFNLHETKLKPRIEQFTKDRVSWFKGGEGVTQKEGNFYC